MIRIKVIWGRVIFDQLGAFISKGRFFNTTSEREKRIHGNETYRHRGRSSRRFARRFRWMRRCRTCRGSLRNLLASETSRLEQYTIVLESGRDAKIQQTYLVRYWYIAIWYIPTSIKHQQSVNDGCTGDVSPVSSYSPAVQEPIADVGVHELHLVPAPARHRRRPRRPPGGEPVDLPTSFPTKYSSLLLQFTLLIAASVAPSGRSATLSPFTTKKAKALLNS